jgi:ABC-type glycerol-3-phosphate transport system substrate-binding protein
MNSKTTRIVVTATAAALLLAGCGGSNESSDASSSPSAANTTPSNTAAPDFTDQQAPPTRLTVDVTIKGGQVTPTNESLQSGLNEAITFRVMSDAVDVLHVHSNPEHSFAIDSKSEIQQFQFTPTVPGKIDVELHDLNKTVATITVQ